MEALIRPVIQACYGVVSVGRDLGSYYRGTNVDSGPVTDLDLMYFGIPNDPQHGYHDWTPQPNQPWSDFSDLEALRALDPLLWQAITSCIEALRTIAAAPALDWVRAGSGTPGVVFSLHGGLDHERQLEVDVTLLHDAPGTLFAEEHTSRFLRYLEATRATYGEGRAAQLLADIRHLKRLVKTEALVQGVIDKKRKVPGFLIESFFTHSQKPATFDEVIAALARHQATQEFLAGLSLAIQEQPVQLVGIGGSPLDVLAFVTQGGYQTLKKVAGRPGD